VAPGKKKEGPNSNHRVEGGHIPGRKNSREASVQNAGEKGHANKSHRCVGRGCERLDTAGRRGKGGDQQHNSIQKRWGQTERQFGLGQKNIKGSASPTAKAEVAEKIITDTRKGAGRHESNQRERREQGERGGWGGRNHTQLGRTDDRNLNEKCRAVEHNTSSGGGAFKPP